MGAGRPLKLKNGPWGSRGWWLGSRGRARRAAWGSDAPCGKPPRAGIFRTSPVACNGLGARVEGVRPGLRPGRPCVFQQGVLLSADAPQRVPQLTAERLGPSPIYMAVVGFVDRVELA